MRSYSELEGFADLYLEDSYLLGVEQSPPQLSLLILAVLLESHPRYADPEPNERYRYAKIRVVFQFEEICWASIHFLPTVDPDGTADFGNIDEFVRDDDGSYIVSGDWGHVSVRSQHPTVEYLE